MASGQDIDAVEAVVTETSPLLARDAPTADVINGEAGPDGTTAPEASQDGNPEMLKKMHILIPAVGVGIFLAAVDQLLTIAIYAKIGNELDALNYTSWIATSYFLTLSSFQPLYGKLSDIFGRKECLLFAYTVFGLGCLGCGLARSMLELCIARAVTGIGGGGMTSIVSILLSDIVPLQDRGIYQGHISIVYAAGTSLGGPLGGILADSIGWRWSFIGQIPLCVIAWLSVFFILDVPPPASFDFETSWAAKLRRVDFLGAATLIAAVIALLVGLDSGANRGWSHLLAIVPLALFPVLAAAFLFVEIKIASHPFAPGHVIFPRAMFACYAANFFGVAGQTGILFFLPLYFQAVLRKSSTESGLLLVPAMVASVVGALVGGVIMKKTGKYYWLTLWSFALLAVSVIPLGMSVKTRTIAPLEIGLVLCAAGAGAGLTTTLIALLANAATEDTAVVIASSYLFRSLGSSMGISISSAVLQQVLRDQLALRLPTDVAQDIEDNVRRNLEYIDKLPPVLADKVRASYQMATLGAFGPVAGYLVIALIATVWVREKSLKR